MQGTTKKHCCNDVFSQKFVTSPGSFCVSAGWCAVALSEVERVPAVHCAKSHWTVCMAPYSPDLNPVEYAVCGVCSRACIAFQFTIWTISTKEYAPSLGHVPGMHCRLILNSSQLVPASARSSRHTFSLI